MPKRLIEVILRRKELLLILKRRTTKLSMLGCEGLLVSAVLLLSNGSFAVGPGAIPGAQINQRPRATQTEAAICNGNCGPTSGRNGTDALRIPIGLMGTDTRRDFTP